MKLDDLETEWKIAYVTPIFLKNKLHSIRLFKVRLNYIIKLNRTKSGATYMAQNLKGV